MPDEAKSLIAVWDEYAKDVGVILAEQVQPGEHR
jgi:hypothetical protein